VQGGDEVYVERIKEKVRGEVNLGTVLIGYSRFMQQEDPIGI
jgi:hypothetical protein